MKQLLKRIACLLGAMLLVGETVCAEPIGNTRVETVVPDTHTVQIEVYGGSVTVPGASGNGSIYQISRHSRQQYLLEADSGYELYQIIYNDTDVTNQGKSGVYEAPEITGDGKLAVLFLPKEETSPDEQRYLLEGYVRDEHDNPLPGITLELHSETRTSVSDENGYYVFQNVESGTHSLLLYQGERFLGMIEFAIGAASGEVLQSKTGEKGKLLITPGVRTFAMSVNVQLQEQGGITLTEVKDTTSNHKELEPPLETEKPNPPDTEIKGGTEKSQTENKTVSKTHGKGAKTGDTASTGGWMALAFSSVVVLLLAGKKKK